MNRQEWTGSLLAGTGLVMTTVVGFELGWGAWRALFLILVVIGLIIGIRAITRRSAASGLQSKGR